MYFKKNIFTHLFFPFYILIIFSFLKKYKQFDKLDFPQSITLLNGNIFVIYKEGIVIYNSIFK